MVEFSLDKLVKMEEVVEHIQQYVSWQRFLAKSSGTLAYFMRGG